MDLRNILQFVFSHYQLITINFRSWSESDQLSNRIGPQTYHLPGYKQWTYCDKVTTVAQEKHTDTITVTVSVLIVWVVLTAAIFVQQNFSCRNMCC